MIENSTPILYSIYCCEETNRERLPDERSQIVLYILNHNGITITHGEKFDSENDSIPLYEDIIDLTYRRQAIVKL